MTNMCSLYFGEVETWNYSIHKEPFSEMLTEHNSVEEKCSAIFASSGNRLLQRAEKVQRVNAP